MVRSYARTAGVVLVLIGIAGLLAGGRPLFGLLLAYEGFFEKDEVTAGIVVYALGLGYLLVGSFGFVVADLFGLLLGGLSTVDDLIHLALGTSGIAAVELSHRGTDRKRRR